ncbi:MAG TPA: hypothetical protein VEL03_09515 [Streptosporangiaceae bacterium]|nr:hypothetical protein [Streptosporangiaceae bacterium]
MRAGARAPWRRVRQFFLVPAITGSLTGPVRGLLAAGFWTTTLAFAWQGVAVGGAAVQGQQLAAAVWMMHLVVWCSLACRRLRRGRGITDG